MLFKETVLISAYGILPFSPDFPSHRGMEGEVSKQMHGA